MRNPAAITPGVVDFVRGIDILTIALSMTHMERQSDRRFVGLCPLHAESNPSFHVNPTKQRFYCHGCGVGGDGIKLFAARHGLDPRTDFASVIRRMTEQFAGHASPALPTRHHSLVPRQTAGPYPDWEPAREPRLEEIGWGKKDFFGCWEIRDTDGRLFAVHIRFDSEYGKEVKWWRNGWGLDGLSPKVAPLYGTERISGFAQEQPVWIVEGEKSADAMRGALRSQVLATVCGAIATPHPHVLEPLRGFEVRLWPDNDQAGIQHMERLSASLVGIAETVRVIAPPKELSAKQDAFDWIAVRFTSAEVYL